jgi:FkbM family methyltransferase
MQKTLTEIRPVFYLLYFLGRLPRFRGKIRLLVWTLKLFRSEGPVPVYVPDRRWLLLTTYNPYLTARLWLGQFQPEFTRVFHRIVNSLPSGASVIDAGANVGYYACIAADALKGKGGRVFAFEPHPVVFSYLQRNRAANALDNLLLVQKALADQTGDMPLFANENYPVSSLKPLLRSQSPLYIVQVVTLDDFMSQYPEDKVEFLKIDTEGAELLVLRGASNVIDRHRPVIMYEESESSFAPFGYQATDIIMHLSSCDYSIFRIKEEFNITYQECNFKFTNMIAVANENRDRYSSLLSRSCVRID